MSVLYQFPISHYCEKARWVLDKKRVPYRTKNLLPGLHAKKVRGLVGKGHSLPVFVDGDVKIGDSSAIARYAEEAYPAPALFPADPAERERAFALEEWFDEHAGPDVRRWIYGLAMARPGGAARLFFGPYGALGKVLRPFAATTFERILTKQYDIRKETIASSFAAIEAAFERIESETGGDARRYLVGGKLSIADITAASLLAALVGPAESPYADGRDLPRGVLEKRDMWRKRPAGKWVSERYACDRKA